MKVEENKLSSDIRAGRLDRVYLLYGKETFLTKMYSDRIIKKSVGTDPIDFNFIKCSGNPDADTLSDYVDGLPVFSDIKLISVKDFDPEKADEKTFSKYIDIISDIPETTILLFFTTGIEYDVKKSKTKKFFDAVQKHGTVCCLESIQPSKIAELIVKKASKGGIVISYDDALYLTERVGGSMASANEETTKLMSYVGIGNTITRQTISMLVAKHLDAGIYDLSNAINSGERAEAFSILGELFDQQIAPEVIMTALSGAYIDLYHAKSAKIGGKSPKEAADMFGYYGGRASVFMNRIYSKASRLEIGYLRETIDILSDTDIKLKSTSADSRTIIEQAITRLFISLEKRR